MEAISKVLVQQTYLDIFECTSYTQIDLKGWIANQDYFVDNTLTSNSFALRAGRKSYLMNALANDCNRMAIATIESICGIKEEPVLKKSAAWGMVRSYYAAFLQRTQC